MIIRIPAIEFVKVECGIRGGTVVRECRKIAKKK